MASSPTEHEVNAPADRMLQTLEEHHSRRDELTDISTSTPSAEHEVQILEEYHGRRDELTDTSDATPSKEQLKHGRKPGILSRKGWLWEILTLLGSLCSFAAVIGLLAFYDGKTVPTWYYGLTLNALVSVLATLFKGTLLMPIASSIGQLAWLRLGKKPSMRLDSFCAYDRASRGPWGSLRFMSGSSIFHVAAIGALITVASIGLDSFFQQTITYAIQPMVNATGEAMVAIAQVYVNIPDNAINSNLPVFEAESAAYNSLFQSGANIATSPPFSCSSGNCTWDPFNTLAIRSQCQDVRDRLQLKCMGQDQDSHCNLTTEDYILAYAIPVPSGDMSQSQIMSINSLDASSLGLSGQQTVVDLDLVRRWGDIPGIISIVPWIRVNGSETFSLQLAGPNTTIEAQVCIFYVAVVEVEASVVNGLYRENVTQEFGGLSAVIGNASSLGNASDPVIVEETTEDGTPWYHMDGIGTVTYQADDRASTRAVQPTEFNVDTYFVGALGLEFAYTVNGKEGGIFIEPDVSDTIATRNLARESSVPQAFERMADYMSFALRMNSSFTMPPTQAVANIGNPSYAPVAMGRSYSQVQFVHIRWPWLALPAALLLLTTVFTFMTIMQSRRAASIGLWKTSPLALPFHADFDEETVAHLHAQEDAGLLSSADGLEDISTKMEAQLMRGKTGVKSMISIRQLRRKVPENKTRWWRLKNMVRTSRRKQ